MENLKKILAVLSAITFITSTGCGKNDDSTKKITYYDESNPYSQKAEGVDKSGSEAYDETIEMEDIPTIPGKLNEKIDLSGIAITLKNIYNAGEMEDWQNSDYKKQVLAFNCDVTNNTDSEITINSFNFNIRNLDGESVYIENGVQELLTAGHKITGINNLNAKIEPGKSISGYATLSVPLDWKTATVYFDPLSGKNRKAISFEITREQLEEP